MKWIARITSCLAAVVLVLALLTRSSLVPADQGEQVRAFTRNVEFDYVEWTLDALFLKYSQSSLNTPRYLTEDRQRALVGDYMDLVRLVRQTSNEVDQIFANPYVTDPMEASAELVNRLETLRAMEQSLKPMVEEVLEYQVSVVVAEDYALGMAGQPIPPVMYHVTDLPNALIVSPRETIRQDHNISLVPEMTIEEITDLERSVEQKLNVSALVVPVGGVGTYPTMVMNTTDLVWLIETIAHEWTHNFLTLRPLGIRYMVSAEMRTINETTANLAGREIGRQVLERFYPEIAAQLAPLPTYEEVEEEEAGEEAQAVPVPTPEPEDPTVFNYYREMNKTRVRVDELLAEGKVAEAEEYMEARRKVFWDHGYQIRRLNQAYFAFYGAYNDLPGGGAAGRDPVGPAVQKLRARSATLTEFLNRISVIRSFDELLAELD